MSAKDDWPGKVRVAGSSRDKRWNPGLRMWTDMENDLIVTSRIGVVDIEVPGTFETVWI